MGRFIPPLGQGQILYYTGRVQLLSTEIGKYEGAGLVGEYQKLSLVPAKFIGIQEEILSKPLEQALGNSHFNLCTFNSNISLQ